MKSSCFRSLQNIRIYPKYFLVLRNRQILFYLVSNQTQWHVKSTKYIGIPLTSQMSDVHKVEYVVMSFSYNIIILRCTFAYFLQILSAESIDIQGGHNILLLQILTIILSCYILTDITMRIFI